MAVVGFLVIYLAAQTPHTRTHAHTYTVAMYNRRGALIRNPDRWLETASSQQTSAPAVFNRLGERSVPSPSLLLFAVTCACVCVCACVRMRAMLPQAGWCCARLLRRLLLSLIRSNVRVFRCLYYPLFSPFLPPLSLRPALWTAGMHLWF